MSLYSGISKYLIENICKKMTADDIINALDAIYAPRIGTMQMFINPTLQTNDDITNVEIAKQYSTGWVYPNGKYISQSIYPEMFELLNDTDYIGKNIRNGSNNVKEITLPNIKGLFKLNPNIDVETLASKHDQEISIPTHKHGFSFDTEAESDIVVKNGCWVWSTRGVGKSSTIDPTTYDGISIPRASSLHASNPNPKAKTGFAQWDMPIFINTSQTTQINTTTTKVTNSNTDVNTKISPKCNNVQILIYIGVPKIS